MKFWRESKKGVSDVGQIFGVGGVGMRCFVKKILKVSQKYLRWSLLLNKVAG